MPAQRRLTVLTRDGLRLDALAQGPEDRSPLVLLHGIADSRIAFEPLLDALPHSIHAIAVSQRGHGESSKPDASSAYSAAHFADDVAATLDAVGHGAGDVLGHSMGAWAALHGAARHPARVRRLVLIGAFAAFNGNAGVAALRDEVAALSDPVDPAFVRAFQQTASAVDLPDAFFEAIMAESLRLPSSVWKNVVAAFLRDDVQCARAALRQPALLIWGDCDPFVSRADQDALRRALPGAMLHVCEGLGHSPHWDRPAMIARAVADFLNAPQDER